MRPGTGASRLLATLLVAGFAPCAMATGGDAAAGAQAFAPCSACHTVTEGAGALIGPNLWGVAGRAVAGVPGFDYSQELKSVGGTWTPERLDAFLRDPQAFAPGTRMGYVGVAEQADREALVSYLVSLRPGGGAITVTATQDFGANWPAGPGQAEAGVLCNSCHSLAIVTQQRLSRDNWDKLLVWMVEEQGMAAQSPERRTLILDYLVEHFGPP
jgi:cytochrome c